MARNLGVNRAEVLKLRDKGLAIREIADRLGCAKTTVAYHLYPRERECVRRLAAKRRKTEKYRKSAHEYYMKHYHSDPEYRAKLLDHMREYMRKRYRSDPEFRSKLLEEYKRKDKKCAYNKKRIEKTCVLPSRLEKGNRE
jgi:AcrR family transcriptional regulator